MRYLVLFFFLTVFLNKADALVRLVPTFENCSYYYSYSGTLVPDKTWNTKDICRITFKKRMDNKWESAYPPVYDGVRREFRGSLVYLSEDTEYDIRLEINENGNWQEKEKDSFKTWSSNPPIGQTMNLSEMQGYGNGKALTISGLKGMANAWIKLTGDVSLDAGFSSDQALYLNNCAYLVLDNLRITGGRLHGILVNSNCSDIRINNADISAWGRIPKDQVYLDDAVNYPATRYKEENDATYLDGIKGEVILDDAGIYLGEKGKRPGPKNLVIERCFIHDPNGWCNPWDGVRTLGTGAGTAYEYKHPQGTTGVYVRSNGGLVMRYNDIVGSQTKRFNDPVGAYGNSNEDGGFNKDADIYGNFFAFGQDDGIELDGGQQNVRFYNNRIEQTLCGISTAANTYGPSYIYRNVVFNLGDSENKKSVGVKNGGGTTGSKGIQFFFHNTFYIDHCCISGVGNGSDSDREMYQAFTRNNILFSTIAPSSSGSKGYAIFEKYAHTNNNFDFDLLANSTLPGNAGKVSVLTPNSEQHAIKGAPAFDNLLNAVFSIKKGSLGFNEGEYLLNFSNFCKDELPDMGAFEVEDGNLIPIRPLKMQSDSYHVNINANGKTSIVVQMGPIPASIDYRISKNRDMDWLSINDTTGKAMPTGIVTIRLESSSKSSKPLCGVIHMRFSNGLSIPITIYCEKNTSTAIDNVPKTNHSSFFVTGSSLYAEVKQNGVLSVFDLNGRTISKHHISEGSHLIPLNVCNGCYILSFEGKGEYVSKKIVYHH